MGILVQIILLKLTNLPISNPKLDLQNINAHTKFGENSMMFTQVIVRKREIRMDGQMYNRQTYRHTEGHTDSQHDIIIPRH